MGKIFGISDLPVSTIMTPFEPVYKAPEKYYEKPFIKETVTQTQKTASEYNLAKSVAHLKKTMLKLVKHK